MACLSINYILLFSHVVSSRGALTLFTCSLLNSVTGVLLDVHFLKLSVFSFSAFYTSSSHHQDSLSMCLLPCVSSNISFAFALIMSHISSHVVSFSYFRLHVYSAGIHISSLVVSVCAI